MVPGEFFSILINWSYWTCVLPLKRLSFLVLRRHLLSHSHDLRRNRRNGLIRKRIFFRLDLQISWRSLFPRSWCYFIKYVNVPSDAFSENKNETAHRKPTSLLNGVSVSVQRKRSPLPLVGNFLLNFFSDFTVTLVFLGIFGLLYCPSVFGHFLDPPGNHPRGAIFPTVD